MFSAPKSHRLVVPRHVRASCPHPIFNFPLNPPTAPQLQSAPRLSTTMVKAAPELHYEVDVKVMTFALKFLNTAPKEKLMVELDMPESTADKVIDQRDFGGYKNLDDIFEKKLMRKKKFNVFRDRLLAYAKDNRPTEKATDDDSAPTSKKGKKKGGATTPQADALLQLQKAEKPVFKETEPLRLRFGYLLPTPVVEAPVEHEAEVVEVAQPVTVA
ncbi:hypothetical protein H310_14588 [Aphanomyces invadans]|uniref:Uncharacterized protein n=1 Tax=Aphanomyces invadans TaxID=157072 RepID=A0A024T9H4_9STRA|nr:hypothetical protein H310_14588 [Aphanomyces invadans]ETV90698.1 hypothetical protein H310_14588 [Aphanomyces invadans]|eukprot:XP_008880695.1 hypothetical protein H310_14588 [Aphanomyces invadans]